MTKRRVLLSANYTPYLGRDVVRLCSRVFGDFRKTWHFPRRIYLQLIPPGRRRTSNIQPTNVTGEYLVTLVLPRDNETLVSDLWWLLHAARGVRHKSDISNFHPPNCSDIIINKVEPKVKPSVPETEILQRQRKRWETKWKRAETALSKIDKKLRRLQGVPAKGRSSVAMLQGENQDLRDRMEQIKIEMSLEVDKRLRAEEELKRMKLSRT